MRKFLLLLSLFLLAGCNLNSKDATLLPTPDIPSVRFIYPSNNDKVIEGTDLILDLYAQDHTIGVERIEVFIDEQLFNEPMYVGVYEVANEFRPQTNWLAQGIGFHAITAIAYRPDGTQSDEARINIEVIKPE